MSVQILTLNIFSALRASHVVGCSVSVLLPLLLSGFTVMSMYEVFHHTSVTLVELAAANELTAIPPSCPTLLYALSRRWYSLRPLFLPVEVWIFDFWDSCRLLWLLLDDLLWSWLLGSRLGALIPWVAHLVILWSWLLIAFVSRSRAPQLINLLER